MPQREMNKVESKYDLLQWMKVTMAITRLKKEIDDKTQDLRALREQRQYNRITCSAKCRVKMNRWIKTKSPKMKLIAR
jgi:phosphoserine aminotransferase